MSPHAPSGRRLLLVAILFASLLLVLAGRLLELTVVRGPALAEAAEDNRTRVVPDPAPRGLILDSSGRALAANTAATGVLIDRSALRDLPDAGDDVLRRTARALGMTAGALRKRLTPCGTPGAAPRPICDDGSAQSRVAVLGDDRAALLPIADTPDRYPGVTLTSVVHRNYPADGVTAGHLLGYLGAVSADELAADDTLTTADLMGRGGLEEQYDADLRGRGGERRLLVDAAGDVTGTEQLVDPVPGHDLITSINAPLQARVDTALQTALAYAGDPDARAGAVVLDVRTGRVLAMGSKPDFSPAQWIGGITQRDYERLSDGGALVPYATVGSSPPGSVFKPVSVLGMVRAGYTTGEGYECPSSYTSGGRTFTNHESEAYGTLSLRQALVVSCNTVFYRAADRLWRQGGGERQGDGVTDPIARAALDLGLGRPAGVDLPDEAAGMVASPDQKYQLWQERRDEWCAAAEAGYPELRRTDPARADYYTALDKENCRSGMLWRTGDAINAAIGQGLTATSPLQMAGAYAAIANGGTVWRPTVARALRAADGGIVREISPQAVTTLPDRSALAFLRRALTGVVRPGGTAAAAFAGFPLDRYPVAGKTGTAQVEGETSTSWFASFAPADAPRYAVVAMVTNGGAGGETAAPAVRSIYEALFGIGTPRAFPAAGPPDTLPDRQGVLR